MFSKEESKKLRETYWISFGKSYPRKWVRYNTKIKGLSLKFEFGLNKAIVSMDIETNDIAQRIKIWEKLESLKPILIKEYLSEVQFEDSFLLENKKEISRVYVTLEDVSIHNKTTWQETMVFMNSKMIALEKFFTAYDAILES